MPRVSRNPRVRCRVWCCGPAGNFPEAYCSVGETIWASGSSWAPQLLTICGLSILESEAKWYCVHKIDEKLTTYPTARDRAISNMTAHGPRSSPGLVVAIFEDGVVGQLSPWDT